MHLLFLLPGNKITKKIKFQNQMNLSNSEIRNFYFGIHFRLNKILFYIYCKCKYFGIDGFSRLLNRYSIVVMEKGSSEIVSVELDFIFPIFKIYFNWLELTFVDNLICLFLEGFLESFGTVYFDLVLIYIQYSNIRFPNFHIYKTQ